jgi:hypothetical protein
MKLVQNTRGLTISNSSAIVVQNDNGDWVDYPGHLGYCSRTGLNRTPKFIPVESKIALTKGKAIFELVNFLKQLDFGCFKISSTIDFSKIVLPKFFMENQNNLILTDKDFPRDLKLSSADGLQKAVMRWVDFRFGLRIQPCKNGEVGHVARLATYHWVVEDNFGDGRYLTTNEINVFLSKHDDWTAEHTNNVLIIRNDSYKIVEQYDDRWLVTYIG